MILPGQWGLVCRGRIEEGKGFVGNGDSRGVGNSRSVCNMDKNMKG